MSYLALVVHSEKLGVGGRFTAANGHQTSPQFAAVKQKVRAAPSISILWKFCPKNRRSGTSGAKSPFDHGSSRSHKHATNRLSEESIRRLFPLHSGRGRQSC